MAVDTKKILADVAKYKKAMADADKNIATIADAYKDVTHKFGGAEGEVKALLKEIVRLQSIITGNIKSLKINRDQAKTVTSDVEMALRKWEEGRAARDELSDNYVEAEKALKKDKNNAELKKKFELAEKALQKQTAAFERQSEDAHRVIGAAMVLGDNMDMEKTHNLEMIKELSVLLDQLQSIGFSMRLSKLR